MYIHNKIMRHIFVLIYIFSCEYSDYTNDNISENLTESVNHIYINDINNSQKYNNIYYKNSEVLNACNNTNTDNEGWLPKYYRKTFFNDQYLKTHSQDYLLNNENIYLNTVDSKKIGAFLIKPKDINNETKFIIFCHGNDLERQRLHRKYDLANKCMKFNICLLIIDYRGYGDSEGSIFTSAINLDILAGFEFLKNQFGNVNIGILGHSLGAGVALEYCRFVKTNNILLVPAYCICLAPFSSPTDIAKCSSKLYSWISYFVPYLDHALQKTICYNNIENAKYINDYLFIVHGEKDENIPFIHSLRIINNTNCYYKITGDDHFSILNNENIWKCIAAIDPNHEFIAGWHLLLTQDV